VAKKWHFLAKKWQKVAKSGKKVAKSGKKVAKKWQKVAKKWQKVANFVPNGRIIKRHFFWPFFPVFLLPKPRFGVPKSLYRGGPDGLILGGGAPPVPPGSYKAIQGLYRPI